MTMFEQEVWAIVCEHGYFWRGRWRSSGLEKEVWEWNCEPESLDMDRVAKCWDTIVAVAEGGADRSDLPTYVQERQAQKFADFDDEIPF
jgi:hypothetical protein